MKKRLFDAGIGGADRRALRFIKMALAFHAEIGIDNIILIALGNRIGRTHRFASATADTGIINI